MEAYIQLCDLVKTSPNHQLLLAFRSGKIDHNDLFDRAPKLSSLLLDF